MVLSLGGQGARANFLHGHIEEVAAAPADIKPMEEIPATNTFPSTYEGRWYCVTTVTESSVTTVSVGQQTTCEIAFGKSRDGRIVGTWNQPGWTEAEASATAFNKSDARVDRTNYYWGEGNQGAWAARSRDAFKLLDQKSMIAKSEVDQYYDGQYLGRYRTQSTLFKISPNEGLASACSK